MVHQGTNTHSLILNSRNSPVFNHSYYSLFSSYCSHLSLTSPPFTPYLCFFATGIWQNTA
ncbi:hypothetical protein K457DRAFT_137801 [Linnemannia elongata AG-77]|uniref:Uncharacterized protein n=1 Tax=Linnemannia elongata AG-77 TaxID=1314771 RepID=A0A197JYT6_9FUNG|nr:hypothetical protein K457DRAFT_137801 [Linnemannia elongata AG-77]